MSSTGFTVKLVTTDLGNVHCHELQIVYFASLDQNGTRIKT